MSSAPVTELTLDKIGPAFAEWLKVRAIALERIGGGRNSQVYKVSLAGAEPLAFKAYFRHAADQRDRLATEYRSFQYLWAHGFREMPEPVAFDAARGWAVYRFIEGEKVPYGEAGDPEVLAAADFLARLRDLSRNAESRELGAASEANFAVAKVASHVRDRLARLQAVENREGTFAEMHAFLAKEFVPLLDDIARWSEGHMKTAGLSFTEELPAEQRTLNPSDFGFHNAIRQPGGRVIFLDFEYFGWDDPAKMIADFLLHPAMNLPAKVKQTFAATLFRRFSDWPGLPARVESAYPLFGLKWCLIFLNEFLPEALLRRQFAAIAPAQHTALQMEQLGKSRRMLAQIRSEYQNFPYRD